MEGKIIAKSTYYTNLLVRGAITHDQVSYPIGVVDSRYAGLPVGLAKWVGKDEGGLAVWRLSVRREQVRGRWVIVDRKFHCSS
jgi:hypothetical protein